MATLEEHNGDIIIRNVSDAPLHLVRPKSTCLRKEQEKELVKSLKEQGMTVRRGQFSDEEDQRLKKNWKRFASDFPEIKQYPSVAFGNSHLPATFEELDPSKIRQLRKECRRRKLLLRMSYKLDDRLCTDVYKRCRRLFIDKRAYSKTSSKELSNKERKSIKKLHAKHGNNWQVIAAKADVGPNVSYYVATKPKKIIERILWSEDDDLIMRSIIAELVGSIDIDEIPSQNIPWAKVSEKLAQVDLIKSKRQCYKRWLTTHKDIRKKKPLLSEICKKDDLCKKDEELEHPIQNK